MMMRSATTSSFGACQRCFEEAADFFIADSAIAKTSDCAGDQRLRFAKRLSPFPHPSVLRHECARAVPQIDDAFALELAVGLCDGIGIHDQLLREWPDSRQLISWT